MSTSTARISQGTYTVANISNDLAYSEGKPYFAQRQETTLELATTDAQGFWR